MLTLWFLGTGDQPGQLVAREGAQVPQRSGYGPTNLNLNLTAIFKWQCGHADVCQLNSSPALLTRRLLCGNYSVSLFCLHLIMLPVAGSGPHFSCIRTFCAHSFHSSWLLWFFFMPFTCVSVCFSSKLAKEENQIGLISDNQNGMCLLVSDSNHLI